MPVIPSVERRKILNFGFPKSQFRDQWRNPSDAFSVLLVLGGDVVARALAQLVGSRVTPVAYSFGWVNYAVSAVVAVVGDKRLMPNADFSCKVINGSNGYVRDNQSWIIGRMVRDFENWMDDENAESRPVHTRLEQLFEEDKKKWTKDNGAQPYERPYKVGLCVSFYEAKDAIQGFPGYDRVYFTGFITCIIQLGLAAVPIGISGDWSMLLITIAGMVLSFLTGALPQWSQEKWACRKNAQSTVVLTGGNGSQHAIVIVSEGKGLNLEDLAAPNTLSRPCAMTKFSIVSLAILWILLLITASGVQDNTWFLLATGGIGMLQNIYVASASRSPEAFGVPLKYVEVIANRKVMRTLLEVEKRYPGVGRSMLATFFPGDLTPEEEKDWADYKVEHRKLKDRKRNKKNNRR